MIDRFPVEKGSYALWLALSEAAQIAVGRLGLVDFPRGDYIYSGSARGSGGLRGRLRHHLQSSPRPHWHIDYLRSAAMIRGVFYRVTEEPLECHWSQMLAKAPGAEIPRAGFGASDCRSGCAAHLVLFPAGLAQEEIISLLTIRGEDFPFYEVIHQP